MSLDSLATLRSEAETSLASAVDLSSLTDWERDGILKSLSHGPNEGNQSVILVHPADAENTTHRVEVKDVRIPEFDAKLNSRLVEEFRKEGVPEQHVDLMAKLVFHWLKPR